MPDFATTWTPPPVPGSTVSPPDTTPADPSGAGDTEIPGTGISGWQEWWGNVAHDVGNWWSGVTAPTADSEARDLAQLIYEKMGPDTTTPIPAGYHGPNPNYLRALQAAYAAQRDPVYRQRLATSMGWNVNNPHVAYWLQHGGGIPSDPTGAGLAPGQTAPAPATPGASTTAPAANAAAPFDPTKWGGRANDPGFTYGAVLPPAIAAAAGVPNQWGVDYALPLGTALNAPFAGKIIYAGFNGPYGNTVVIQMSNGYTYRVAHLSAMNVVVGQTVTPGSLLGAVGSTGNSTGPHVLIEMRDNTGKSIDPTPIMDSLLKGDYTGATKTLGDYVTAAASQPGPFLTSDGHLIYPGSQDYNVFFAAQQLWRKRYGGDPPWSFVSSLIAQGATTSEQIQGQMDQMSSDFPGMNWGQRDALASDANNASLKAWDRPLPDATIKNLASQGITTPGQIQGWIMSHPATAIDPGDYRQIFDGLNPQTQSLWNQPPSPDLVKHIHDQMQTGPA